MLAGKSREVLPGPCPGDQALSDGLGVGYAPRYQNLLEVVGRRLGVATAAIDLDELRKQTEHRRNSLLRERLPNLYGEIVRGD